MLKTSNLKMEPKLTFKRLTIELQQIIEEEALIGMRESIASHYWGDCCKAELTFHYLLNSYCQILDLGKREFFVVRDKFLENFSELLYLRTGTRLTELAYVLVETGS